MSISHAILGLLSVEPMTGYDLKKVMQESPFMHWSGNNNQIYKALVELAGKGYVQGEVKHRESAPSKKVYTITKEGLVELKCWLLSAPETPEMKKPFLVQLAWSHQLETREILALLEAYRQEIAVQMAMEQAKQKKGRYAPARTARETAIWNVIYGNVLRSYSAELDWASSAIETIGGMKDESV